MEFPYQSVFLTGSPPPSLPTGTIARFRPLIPVTISNPSQTRSRSFARALLDTGADDTIFPSDLLQHLGLAVLPSTGQRVVWRGVPYAIDFAEVALELSDGDESFVWKAVVGFSVARIGYPILGQAGVLQHFRAAFSGET